MTPDTAALLDELRRAFPAKRESRFQPLVNSHLGSEPWETAREFENKDDWTTLDSDWLDVTPYPLGSALSFLSDDAICFYIPAYIAADLAGLLKRVNPVFHLTHGFDNESRNRRISKTDDETWGAYAARRWQSLNTDQVCAVVHYLEWYIGRKGLDFAREAHQALQTYWYPRAGCR